MSEHTSSLDDFNVNVEASKEFDFFIRESL